MNDKEFEFTKIVKEYKKTIYTVCYFYSKNSEEVEDLYQEVLISLWNGFSHFRGDCSMRTWVWRVSLNTCTSFERKKKRRVATVPLTMDIACIMKPMSRAVRYRCCMTALIVLMYLTEQ